MRSTAEILKSRPPLNELSHAELMQCLELKNLSYQEAAFFSLEASKRMFDFLLYLRNAFETFDEIYPGSKKDA